MGIGCELLLIDAEGHDTRILRSMIAHCQEQEKRGRDAWPHVMVFESAGICDASEGFASEDWTVKQLEECGYFVFVKTWMNTDMIRREAVEKSEKLRKWLDEVHCSQCKKKDLWPQTLRGGHKPHFAEITRAGNGIVTFQTS